MLPCCHDVVIMAGHGNAWQVGMGSSPLQPLQLWRCSFPDLSHWRAESESYPEPSVSSKSFHISPFRWLDASTYSSPLNTAHYPEISFRLVEFLKRDRRNAGCHCQNRAPSQSCFSTLHLAIAEKLLAVFLFVADINHHDCHSVDCLQGNYVSPCQLRLGLGRTTSNRIISEACWGIVAYVLLGSSLAVLKLLYDKKAISSSRKRFSLRST